MLLGLIIGAAFGLWLGHGLGYDKGHSDAMMFRKACEKIYEQAWGK